MKPRVSIELAESAFSNGDLERAEQLTRALLISDGENSRALLLSAKIAGERGQIDEALELADSAWKASRHRNALALQFRANFAFANKRLMAAVDSMSRLAEQFPQNAEYQVQAGVINLTVGREDVAADHARRALLLGRVEPSFLFLLCDTSRPFGKVDVCREAVEAYPEDPRPLISVADVAAYKRDWRNATEIAHRILKAYPNDVPAYLVLGRCLVEQTGRSSDSSSSAEVDRWLAGASQATREQADYWVLFGRVLTRRGEHDRASRCFWQALRIDPSHINATNRLAISLQQIDRKKDAQLAAERSRQLILLRENLDRFLGTRRSYSAACSIAHNLDDLGRLREAYSWGMIAAQMPKSSGCGVRRLLTAIADQVKPATPIQLVRLDVSRKIDLSSISLPELEPPEGHIADLAGDVLKHEGRNHAAIGRDAEKLRLRDQAEARGLRFHFFSGDDPEKPGMMNHQSNGGGVGVIDYNLDGQPDLYLTTGSSVPLVLGGGEPNALFRNRDGRLENIAKMAGVDLTAFNTGLAVGDFNQDGFPDLYVAAIGQNRLLRNNGDGTFREVTDRLGVGPLFDPSRESDDREDLPADRRWTSSVAMTDINGDGYTDLYDVNYLAGRSTFTTRCSSNKPGIHRVCNPIDFPAETDRVLLGTENGEFVDASNHWFQGVMPGRGLGVLVGNLDGAAGLDLFVANDMSPNLYFHSVPAKPAADSSASQGGASAFTHVESAVVRGLAFDRYASPQACMGIAAADLEQDGFLDLLVTNFYNESNTLYRQVSQGVWQDVSHQVGIAQPSRKVLGFGCHFVDLDNDLDVELFVANGHVFEMVDEGVPFKMVAQILQQVGTERGAQWEDVDRDQLGRYFTSTHVGRSVAILDINRDRRQDLCLLDLIEPAALLVNETPDVGRSSRLRLIATRTHRDAVGTTVRWTIDGMPQSAQLFSGDGYHCSNERMLHLAFGDTKAESIDIDIDWPSGERETVSIRPEADYLAVEGVPTLFEY